MLDPVNACVRFMVGVPFGDGEPGSWIWPPRA
ncbi:hypothetical protein CL76_gp03 [Mycobacterium phage Larva]|uniref:Uncharacterized protein n=1 Tax=Mycobacterium phage Larva TaxID=2922990 RepID=G1FMQ6_9CAUD|nr:hypothetical protein CL76_gp03 [Mycobacterium phage Larva]AEL19751.1 hypothetical protein LARVA_3 [Mycobacterium phage Larva]